MPIKIPRDLPAARTLTEEQVFFMVEDRAYQQDIRPLHILVINLMPNKAETETQFFRLLGNTPLQVEGHLIYTASYTPRHTSQQYLAKFYKTFDEIKDRTFDGCVITGAPVELMNFEDVHYWRELCSIMEWTKTHVTSTLHVCWGAQAGLYYHYGIPKIRLPEKLSGVFSHEVVWPRPIKLFRGFDDRFDIPHSRYTEIDEEAVAQTPELRELVRSDSAGLTCLGDRHGRQFFLLGHLEYEPDSLKHEYMRDLARGQSPKVPVNYFPEDDPAQPPVCSWRSSANLLFANWLNYYVYQQTPYEIADIPQLGPEFFDDREDV